MQKRLVALAMPAALATLALTGEARAQEFVPPYAPAAPVRPPEPPAQWGLHTGDTVDKGHAIVYAEFGWPDVASGFQYGVSSYADVGFRQQISYGVDYVIPKGMGGLTDVALPPGLALSVPIRLTVVRNERVSFLAHIDPGFKFDYLFPAFFGPQLPIGFELGMHLTPRSTLTLGVDVPISIRVTPDITGIIPFLFGLAFEGHVSQRFGLVLNARTGVVHAFNRTGSDTDLGLLLQGGFVVRTGARAPVTKARAPDPPAEASPP